MHAGNKINLFILSYWICNTILLVAGKKYPCVLNERVPIEEFGSAHYGELGYLRNVIVDVAQFIHKQMKLETPLRLCKLLSKFKISYFDVLRISWKKKTRDKYSSEFNLLEKTAERVLEDLIKDARLTPEFPKEDQEALAKVIDVAKERLLKSKTYTNEDGLLLNNLNTLRGTYCPKVPGSIPEDVKSLESQSNSHRIDQYAKPPVLGELKTMTVEPSTIGNLANKTQAIENVPSVPSLINSVNVLPKLLLSPLKDQQTQEPGGYSAPIPIVLPSPPKLSMEPLSESGQVGSPKSPSSDWIKPMPQPNQAVPMTGQRAPSPLPWIEAKCFSGNEFKSVRVDKDAIDPAYTNPFGMAASSPSAIPQNNQAHTSV